MLSVRAICGIAVLTRFVAAVPGLSLTVYDNMGRVHSPGTKTSIIAEPTFRITTYMKTEEPSSHRCREQRQLHEALQR